MTRPLLLLAGRSSPGSEGLLLQEAFALTGGKAPTVGYVGAAHGDDPVFFARMAGLLRAAGSGKVRLAPLAGAADDGRAARAVLENSDIVFMSGGDVEAGMRLLRARRLPGLLRELQRQGRVFVGVSAGSIMLCERWVRWRDPEDVATAQVLPCLGLARLHCDTHDEEGGWAELKALLRLIGDGVEGYGIPAGGALLVSSDGTVEARGKPAVRIARRRGRFVRLAPLPPPIQRPDGFPSGTRVRTNSGRG